MKKNYLVTGKIGTCKSTVAYSMASRLGARPVVFDHTADSLPIEIGAEAVVLDEPRVEVVLAHLEAMKAWLGESVQVVYVCRDVAGTPGEVLALLQDFGGFYHIQTSALNEPLIDVEIVPLNSSAATWEMIFGHMREDMRERSIDRILSEFSAAVSNTAMPSLERSALNARLGLLASAVRRKRE